MDAGIKRKIFLRSFLIQAGWNDQRMQNMGFAFAIYPALAALYKGRELCAGMKRHLGFFNTHPFMAGFALGLAARLEEQGALSGQPHDTARVEAIKSAVAPPLGAIGDRFFWAALRPASLSISLLALWALGLRHLTHPPEEMWRFQTSFGAGELLVGLAAGLAVYNGIAIWVRWKGISYGYQCGAGGSCGLDFVNWQGMIRKARLAGFCATVLLIAMKLIVFWRLKMPAALHGHDALAYLLAPPAMCAAFFTTRSGKHVAQVYGAVICICIIAFALAY
ncbi:MAG: PTS system mannose/fructose/sorbose family transporter subunit IID [Elusimicrobiales bacterium]